MPAGWQLLLYRHTSPEADLGGMMPGCPAYEVCRLGWFLRKQQALSLGLDLHPPEGQLEYKAKQPRGNTRSGEKLVFWNDDRI